MEVGKNCFNLHSELRECKLERASTNQMFCKGKVKGRSQCTLNPINSFYGWPLSASHWSYLYKWLFLPGLKLGLMQAPALCRLINDSFLLAAPSEGTLQWILLTAERHRKPHTALYKLRFGQSHLSIWPKRQVRTIAILPKEEWGTQKGSELTQGSKQSSNTFCISERQIPSQPNSSREENITCQLRHLLITVMLYCLFYLQMSCVV